MKCPFAKWLPVSNAGGPMASHKGLVLHVQEGNGSLYGYFNNPASQVSAHFWCAKTGALEQYVDTDRVAWAEAAGNPNYLSVETEGFTYEALTGPQISTVALLLEWCAAEYSFPITGPVPHGAEGFTPHCNPNGTPDPAWGNHTCPGSIRLDQMPEIIARAAPVPVPLPEGTENMPSIVVTISGTEYLVTNVLVGGHWKQVRQTVASLGTPSTSANTSIIDLTVAWPSELTGVSA